jgi:hypothetical protein
VKYASGTAIRTPAAPTSRHVQAVEEGFLHQRLVEECAEVAHREAAVGVHEGAVEHRAHRHGQEQQQKTEHQ